MRARLLGILLFLHVFPFAHSETAWKWDDEIHVIAQHTQIDRIYRVGVPLRKMDSWLWLVFAVPSDSLLRKQLGDIDTASLVVSRSRLYCYEVHRGQEVHFRRIPVKDEVFTQLLSAFYVSE